MKSLGVSRQLVSGWWTGRIRPGPDYRARLALLYLVPIVAWDRPAQEPTSPDAPAAPPRARAKVLDVLAAPEPPDDDQEPVEGDDLGESLWPEIRSLRSLAKRPASPRDTIAVQKAIGQMIARQREIDRANLDLEDGWAKSTSFRHMCRDLFELLQPYPDALASVKSAWSSGGLPDAR